MASSVREATPRRSNTRLRWVSVPRPFGRADRAQACNEARGIAGEAYHEPRTKRLRGEWQATLGVSVRRRGLRPLVGVQRRF